MVFILLIMLIIHESFVSSSFNLFKFKRKSSTKSPSRKQYHSIKGSKQSTFSPHRSSKRKTNRRRIDELNPLEFFLPPSNWPPLIDDYFSNDFSSQFKPSRRKKKVKKVFPNGHRHHQHSDSFNGHSGSFKGSLYEQQRIPSTGTNFRRAYLMDDSQGDTTPSPSQDPDRVDTQLHPLPIYGSTSNHFESSPIQSYGNTIESFHSSATDPFLGTSAEKFLTPPLDNHVPSLSYQPPPPPPPRPPPCEPVSAFRSEDEYEEQEKCKPETIIKYKIQKIKMPPKIVYKVKKVYIPKPVQVIKEVPVIKHVPIIKEKEKVVPIVKKKIIVKKIKVPVPYKVKYIKIKKVPVVKKIKVPVIRKVVKFIPKTESVKHIHLHKVYMKKDKKKKMGMMKKMKMKMKKKKMMKMMASMVPMCPGAAPMLPMMPMVPPVPGLGRRKRGLDHIPQSSTPSSDSSQLASPTTSSSLPVSSSASPHLLLTNQTKETNITESRSRERRGILSSLAAAAFISNNPGLSKMMMTMNQGNRMKFADECADDESMNSINPFSSLLGGSGDDSNGMDDTDKRKKRRRKKRSFERSLLLGPRIVFFDEIGWKFYGPVEQVQFEEREEEEATISLSDPSSSGSASSNTTSTSLLPTTPAPQTSTSPPFPTSTSSLYSIPSSSN